MNDLSDPSDELYSPELTDDNQSSNKSPYSINTIQFSNINSHTKKSQFNGPDFKQIETVDDSTIESDIDYNWNNPSDYANNLITIKHDECPNGASKKQYQVIAAINHRYNPNIGTYQYKLISQDPENPNKYFGWWTEFINKCPQIIIEYYEQKFLISVLEDHENRTNSEKVKVTMKRTKKSKLYSKISRKWSKKRRRTSKNCSNHNF